MRRCKRCTDRPHKFRGYLILLAFSFAAIVVIGLAYLHTTGGVL